MCLARCCCFAVGLKITTTNTRKSLAVVVGTPKGDLKSKLVSKQEQPLKTNTNTPHAHKNSHIHTDCYVGGGRLNQQKRAKKNATPFGG